MTVLTEFAPIFYLLLGPILAAVVYIVLLGLLQLCRIVDDWLGIDSPIISGMMMMSFIILTGSLILALLMEGI